MAARKKKVIINPPQPSHANEQLRPSGERPCPICREHLQSKSEQRSTVDLCPDHGVWLDRGELDRLLAAAMRRGSTSRRAAVDRARRQGVMRGLFLGTWALLDTGGPATRSRPPRRGWPTSVEPQAGPKNADLVPEGARPCPVCDATMRVEAMENILVDHCDAHGLWLDDDELAEMTRALSARARRSASTAARRAHRSGAVDANIFGLFALLK